ncbi:hypothetical protein ABEB36_006986 [Hypothenemus hampei]|uniref:Protein kinase domain-containing protein n=1 Tax=Hypothenemus hampei TaxID=57062 RepID=A0ABD1ESF8_HYPHA
MSRWTVPLIQKYSQIINNIVSKRKNTYINTGIAIGSATVAVGNISSDDSIVIGIKGLLRFVRCLKIGLTISLDYYFCMTGLTEGTPNYDIMMSRIHQRSADRIRDGCLQNEGTYVKLGQGLVSLSHILPKEYISTLKVLQDKCLPRNKEELYTVFQEDLGKSPEELFETFDFDPIAAASIAQVFKARTKEGKMVAVKVQYNDLRKRLGSDVMTINILLTISTWLHPKVDFTWVLNDFEEALKQELDFVNEGLNGERCAKDLRHLKYVHVPNVLWKYTNTRILVTEFIDGIKISSTEDLKEQGFSLVDINKKLFEAFGYQIFQSGFVHADPHPGNILIRKRNKEAELILLDHGLYQKVDKEATIALSYLWKAIVLNDHEKMQIYSKQLGVEDYTMFAEVLTQSPLRTMGFKLKAKLTEEERNYMKKVAGEKFDQIVSCLQQMPRSLLLVIRNLNTIRAISYDHGCPIDRYAVLARMATKAAFAREENNFLKRSLAIPKHFWFEFNLQVARFINYFNLLFWKFLYLVGIAPDVNALKEKITRDL